LRKKKGRRARDSSKLLERSLQEKRLRLKGRHEVLPLLLRLSKKTNGKIEGKRVAGASQKSERERRDQEGRIGKSH